MSPFYYHLHTILNRANDIQRTKKVFERTLKQYNCFMIRPDDLIVFLVIRRLDLPNDMQNRF